MNILPPTVSNQNQVGEETYNVRGAEVITNIVEKPRWFELNNVELILPTLAYDEDCRNGDFRLGDKNEVNAFNACLASQYGLGLRRKPIAGRDAIIFRLYHKSEKQMTACAAYIRQEPATSRAWKLLSLAVSPSLRGEKLGSRLLLTTMKILRVHDENGCKKVVLMTGLFGIETYAKAGFFIDPDKYPDRSLDPNPCTESIEATIGAIAGVLKYDAAPWLVFDWANTTQVERWTKRLTECENL